MKEYKDEPKIGPTEDKQPTTLHVKHSDLPGIETAAPGDRVKLIVHGHVHGNRAKDQFGDGEAHIDIHSIERADNEKSKKNASTMRMDELKAHIEKLGKTDKDMEGHEEDAIKEEGKDE
jgi:hypothetical protein